MACGNLGLWLDGARSVRDPFGHRGVSTVARFMDVTYTIDSNLNRQTLAGEAGKGISVFGDSFIFGEGLEDHQTIPQELANLQQRRSPIYNLWFSAYNPAHALALIQSGIVDRILSNTRVIVKFVAPWHAERTT